MLLWLTNMYRQCFLKNLHRKSDQRGTNVCFHKGEFDIQSYQCVSLIFYSIEFFETLLGLEFFVEKFKIRWVSEFCYFIGEFSNETNLKKSDCYPLWFYALNWRLNTNLIHSSMEETWIFFETKLHSLKTMCVLVENKLKLFIIKASFEGKYFVLSIFRVAGVVRGKFLGEKNKLQKYLSKDKTSNFRNFVVKLSIISTIFTNLE